jgi:CRISPR-associated protein Cas2
MHLVICYDVQDDKRRGHVVEILLDHGVRVQKSVFECEIKPEQFAILRQRLLEALDLDEDSLCLYHLCQSCRLRVERFGASRQRYEESQTLIL